MLLGIEFYIHTFFPFNTLNILLHSRLDCIVSDKIFTTILIFVAVELPFPWLPENSLFDVLQFDYNIHTCNFFDIYPAWCFMRFLEFLVGVS